MASDPKRSLENLARIATGRKFVYLVRVVESGEHASRLRIPLARAASSDLQEIVGTGETQAGADASLFVKLELMAAELITKIAETVQNAERDVTEARRDEKLEEDTHGK